MSKKLFKRISVLLVALFTFLLIPSLEVEAFTLGRTPTGICVTYYDDIDSRGFAWQTSQEITETKLLVVKDNGQTVNWDSAQVINGTYVDFNEFRCHKAQVTDLTEGKYYYKVGSTGAYSDVGSFVIDSTNDGKVSFTYVTDSQETSIAGFENFNKTLTTAVKHNPDFIAFAGDLVDNSHAGWGSDMSKVKMEEWSYAFDTTKTVTMNYPFMSASGNHERAGYTFVNHSNIDYVKAMSTGGYYSFDYNNLHFIALDTNVFEEGKQDEIDAQVKWLEEDLAATDKEWKVVILHIGAYSTGDHSNDSSAIRIRNMLPPIFAKYKVDLVLQGHDHVYTRTMPYYYGENENGKIPNRNEMYYYEDGYNWSLEPDGTYYITINYAGTKSYPPVDYDSSRIFPAKSPVNGKTMSQHVKNRMFAHIEIDGDQLLMQSFIAHDDGSEELYDYVAIKKNTYEDAIAAIDNLNDTVTAKDAPELKAASDLVNGLSERALAYLTQTRIDKLNSLLATYKLEDGLAAHDAIVAIEKLDTKNYDEVFWNNYRIANDVYFNLTEEQKELVYNSSDLLYLKENINQSYYIKSVQKLIDNIENAKNKEEARLIAKMAYDLLNEESKASIKNAEILNQSFAQEPIEGDDKGCGGAIMGSLTAVVILSVSVGVIRRKRGEFDE